MLQLLAALKKDISGKLTPELVCAHGGNDDLDKNLLHGSEDSDGINTTAVEMLLKVPGVNDSLQVTAPCGGIKRMRALNVIMEKCDCLEELAGKDKKELKAWGLGISTVEKIWTFFNTPVLEETGTAQKKSYKKKGGGRGGVKKGSKKRKML